VPLFDDSSLRRKKVLCSKVKSSWHHLPLDKILQLKKAIAALLQPACFDGCARLDNVSGSTPRRRYVFDIGDKWAARTIRRVAYRELRT